jgi:hypothetical protein
MESLFVDTACAVAWRIVRSAVWSADQCTWSVICNRGSNAQPRYSLVPAGHSIYQGTAGMALYLSEIFAVTGDPNVWACAEGAFAHASATRPRARAATFGLYQGDLGYAYVAARMAMISGSERFVSEARHVVDQLVGNETTDCRFDVISGGAGAIPALLTIAHWLDLPHARACALALGGHLAAQAHRQPVGWSWPGRSSNARDLTGFAHGAAGFAHAFIELYATTGSAEHLFYADQAIAYERDQFDHARDCWPDYRNFGLQRLVHTGSVSAVSRLRMNAGKTLLRYTSRSMCSWCHGAPGIGLSRLRAYQVTGDPTLSEEVMRALAIVRDGLASASNFSLCHGKFGNCEFLLDAASYFGMSELRRHVEELAEEACRDHATPGTRWLTGAAGRLPDPSLMMGEAGIGHFLLRLANPSIPSILLLTSTQASLGNSADVVRAGACYQAQREAEITKRFPQSMAAYRILLGENRTKQLVAYSSSPGVSSSAVCESLEQLASASHTTCPSHLLQDATALETATETLRSLVYDFGLTLIIDSLCEHPRNLDLARLELVLRPDCLLVLEAHDWAQWLSARGTRQEPDLRHPPQAYLLRVSGRSVVSQAITPLRYLVLRHANAPRTLDWLMNNLAWDYSSGARPSDWREVLYCEIEAAVTAGELILSDVAIAVTRVSETTALSGVERALRPESSDGMIGGPEKMRIGT